jgi:hypothetical protein
MPHRAMSSGTITTAQWQFSESVFQLDLALQVLLPADLARSHTAAAQHPWLPAQRGDSAMGNVARCSVVPQVQASCDQEACCSHGSLLDT